MLQATFVFGAGASADAGVPVVSRFSDAIAKALQSSHLDDPVMKAFRAVRYEMKHPEYTLAYDPENIEDLFSIADMLSAAGLNEGEQLRQNLLLAITAIVEYRLRPTGQVPAWSYYQLLALLRDTYGEWESQKGGKPPFTFLTLNYDLGVEAAIRAASRDFLSELLDVSGEQARDQLVSSHDRLSAYEIHDLEENGFVGPLYHYGFPMQDRLSSSIELLKLHGSINWGICPICGRDRVFRVNWDSPAYPSVIERSSRSECYWHIGPERPRLEPLIVPPTWNKSPGLESLRFIWKKALHSLRMSRRIVFVGYSFPATDVHIRYLCASALKSHPSKPRILVVSPGPDQALEERYRAVFGGLGADLQFVWAPFADALGNISDFLSSNWLEVDADDRQT